MNSLINHQLRTRGIAMGILDFMCPNIQYIESAFLKIQYFYNMQLIALVISSVHTPIQFTFLEHDL